MAFASLAVACASAAVARMACQALTVVPRRRQAAMMAAVVKTVLCLRANLWKR